MDTLLSAIKNGFNLVAYYFSAINIPIDLVIKLLTSGLYIASFVIFVTGLVADKMVDLKRIKVSVLISCFSAFILILGSGYIETPGEAMFAMLAPQIVGLIVYFMFFIFPAALF